MTSIAARAVFRTAGTPARPVAAETFFRRLAIAALVAALAIAVHGGLTHDPQAPVPTAPPVTDWHGNSGSLTR